VAVNDVNVLAAWAREHGATGKISMVSDGRVEFTRAIGLDQDLSERGLGVRSKRYAMIIEDGKVSDIQVEPQVHVILVKGSGPAAPRLVAPGGQRGSKNRGSEACKQG
jgi:peroxiredoxin